MTQMDTVFEFSKAVYYSDVAAMRRLFREEPEMFRKLRERKDWTAADALRAEIEKMGWKVEDGIEGGKLRKRVP